MRPTPRFAILVVGLSVAAIFVPYLVVVMAGFALTGAALADAYSARGRVDIRRHLPDVIVRGKDHALTVDPSTNDTVEIRQPVPAFISVFPDQSYGRLDALLASSFRGRYRIPPVAVRRHGPLGLVTIDRESGDEKEISVFPDLPGGRRIARQLSRQMVDPSGLRRSGAIGLGTDFESVREYSPNDDVRQINWAATQRTGRPMSNVYRIEQERDVICMLDTGRLMAAPVSNLTTRLDIALDGVVAVAAAADEMGDRCSAVAFDQTIRASIPPRRKNAALITAALYDITHTNRDSDYQRAFQMVAGRKRSFVILFTDLFDLGPSRTMLEASPILARRHQVMVMSVKDPGVETILTTAPDNVVDAARMAIANDLLEQRAHSMDQLRSAGVEVVETSESKLPAAAVRAYLQAKVLARL